MDDQPLGEKEDDFIQQLLKTGGWWKIALLVLLLFPLVILIQMFEIVGSVLVVVSVFVFSVTIYLIFAGDGTPLIVGLCIGSTLVLAAYFVIFPLVARSKKFKKFAKR